ncbi:unnamed protein product [Oreochromis niloticus]|nr:unnamed protein product [Mustela putorius furo]
MLRLVRSWAFQPFWCGTSCTISLGLEPWEDCQDYWRTWLKGLRFFMFIGIFFSLLALATFVVFLAIGVLYKDTFTDPQSFFLSCVWSVMTLKWSFMLTHAAQQYRIEFEDIGILSDF